MELRVPIAHEDCVNVERLFYEYSGLRDIVGFLAEKPQVNKEILADYVRQVQELYAPLEKMKQLVDEKVRPDGINPISYTFDFENEELIYELEE